METTIFDDTTLEKDPYKIDSVYTWNDPDMYAKMKAGANGKYDLDSYLVVMPSIREIAWEHYEPLAQLHFIICDDSDGRADRHGMKPGQWNHLAYRYGDMQREIVFPNVFLADRNFTISHVGDENLWLFPNHNPSVKNIGLYFAVKEGYKGVILLDDDVDCRGCDVQEFFTLHRPTASHSWKGTSPWVNTLALINPAGKVNKIFARGYPYEHRNKGFVVEAQERLSHPWFNQGLWVGNPDINGMDKLEMLNTIDGGFSLDSLVGAADERRLPWFIDPETKVLPGQVRLEMDQRLPLSIMNVQIDAKLIPAFYQPVDYPIYNSFKVRRHDDIWSMYFLCTIMHRLYLDITVGDPLVYHRKQSNIIGEMLSEHYTNLIQPYMTDIVDEADASGYNHYYGEGDVGISTVALMAQELSARILAFGYWDKVPGESKSILRDYYNKTRGWSKLFI